MKKLAALFLALAMMLSFASITYATEPVELIWWMGTTADAPIDQQMVEEKLNEITREALGITIKCVYMTSEEIALAINSGEYYDMAFTTAGWYNDFATAVFDGLFLDLTDLVKTETPALWDSMPEMLWQGSFVNDRLYAVPVMKDYGIEVFWIIDIDYYVTEKGMDIPANMTFAEMEPLLEAYKADHPTEYPLILSKGGITSWANFLDWVSEDAQISLSYSDVGTDEAGTVRLIYEMPEFVERVKTIRSWYEKGYINPDAAVIQSLGRTAQGVIQSGQGFYGADSIWSNARQKASAISRYDGPFLSTYSLRGSLTAINVATKHPVEALKLIEYANTNKEYRNMMRYGLEDVHYTWNEDGTVTKTPQGQTNYSPWAYTQASYSLSAVEASPFPSVPADPNMWQVVWDGYKDAVTSAGLGFAFDHSSVANQVNAAKAIKELYWSEMITGTSDPEVVFPQIIEELEGIGIREVVAEAQRQLNEFLGK